MSKERRGRKPNPNGKILSNGLFVRQWNRIQKQAVAEGVDAAVLQRRIIDWYFTAVDQQEGLYSHKPEFEKLSKASPTDEVDSVG